MRVAWFSPTPPVTSGIAAYTADLLPRLAGHVSIHAFIDLTGMDAGRRREALSWSREISTFDAHDFVWLRQREPYDLIVYQLGNAPCHDYMWAYLARYPGLVVLHDARLHHARARQLLNRRRFDDYRAELRYDQPELDEDVAEYSVEGLGGPIVYLWPMLRVVMSTARLVAVHSPIVASNLAAHYPNVPIQAIRMGVPSSQSDAGTRAHVRHGLDIGDDAIVFATFGKVTPEKRIGPILRALGTLVAEGVDAYLLVLGDATGYGRLIEDAANEGVGNRVRVQGHVPDEAIPRFLAAADICLCLRWPTALETSASWLRCLAAQRATVLTELAHCTDIPLVHARTWQPSSVGIDAAAVGIDLLDEDESLLVALRRLVTDASFRHRIALGGHRYWSAGHTLEAMAGDYQRLLASAMAQPAPDPIGLPEHFMEDYGGLVRDISGRFSIDRDIWS